jgi:hypothetical protein
MQRRFANPLMETALVKHAEAARSEVEHLIDEFMTLARTTRVPTPTIDRVLQYYAPDAPAVPDGSAEIPLDRGGIFAALGMLAVSVGGTALVAGRRRRRRRRRAGTAR